MKNYTKPAIGIESFFLSSAVVNTCEITQLNDERLNVPGFFDKDGLVARMFTSKENCTFNVELWGSGDGADNGVCYHNPTTELNLFNS